ncbi:MAG: DUF1501 domain-containing protein [Planctomycetales bacterium]|nr:DUF1501 domain-containing protein [Planctomycetales bacterium]
MSRSKRQSHKSSPLPRGAGYFSRRDMLQRAGAGFGAIALQAMLQAGQARCGDKIAQEPHHRPTAKSVIFVFLEGGPSHIDLLDPKPELNRLAGQQLPDSFEPIITPMGEYDAPLMASPRRWKQCGESGQWFSDWIPHIGECADDIAVIRSCWGNGLNHSNGVCQMNTGSIVAGRPSLGAWVSYGLGTENQGLPGFVVIEDNVGKVVNGARNWGPGFMPASYQGTPMTGSAEPIRFLSRDQHVSERRQLGKLHLLESLNRGFADEFPDNSELEARIRAYELAHRMQSDAPEAVDLRDESAETLALYGIDNKTTETFGRNCLLARRLVERGVRFVQLYHGAGSKWDSHSAIEKNHSALCAASDKPVAGLLKDLKRRGLLDSTLVVWGGEFGRTPMSEKGDGRDHNCNGFSMWMAGGGVRGGMTIGATDEIGLHAIEDRLHIHDIHATILHAVGIDHWKLVYAHQGRPERATQNEGHVCKKLFG